MSKFTSSSIAFRTLSFKSKKLKPMFFSTRSVVKTVSGSQFKFLAALKTQFLKESQWVKLFALL
ncbi:hypothetical protein J514_0718 [Acinetobacter sp. 1396970]|nr:hypothetical protein J514_0718 [Acinetobacter sp. 1396970]